MKRITVINNYDSFVYNLVRYLEENDCTVTVQRNDEIDYSIIDRSDALVLSPGPGIPSEAGNLMEVIHRYASQKNILGVCLGHQALAEYFGGTLSKAATAVHGKQSAIHVDNNSRIFKSMEAQIDVGRYHSWRVEQLPESLRTIAALPSGEIMAIEHETLPIYGVQFHPESILTPTGRTIIANWLNATT